MQSLLSWDELARSVPSIGPAEEDADALPATVSAIVAAWNGYRDLVLSFRKQVEELRTAEAASRSLDPEDDNGRMVIDRYEARIKLDEIFNRARRSLARAASREFAPEGADLNIADEEWPRCEDAETFNPVWFWRVLEEQFGGNAGRNRAYGDVAKAFASELRIERGIEPKIVGGRVVLSTTVYGRDTWELTSRAREDLGKILRGIATIGIWGGLWSEIDAQDLAHARDVVSDNSNEKAPRMAIGGHVVIVPYKEKWEFRVSQPFAEKIQLFLNQFGGWCPRS
jgi:hypothetical protein